MDTFGERLKAALEARDMSHSALALAAGISQGSVSSMVQRAGPSKHVFALARALQVRPEWLALGEGPMQLPEYGQARVAVPHYDIRVSAGPGAIVEQEAKAGEFACPIEVVRRFVAGGDPRACVFVSVEGDSMKGTVDQDDLLLVDTGVREVGADGVYVIVLDDLTQVKRLERRPKGRLAVRSDNARYQELVLPRFDPETLYICGRARAVWRPL